MSEKVKILNSAISDVLGIDIDDILETLDKKSCEQWDSFNHIVLMDEIEKALDVRISMEESEKIDSYSDLYKILENKGVL